MPQDIKDAKGNVTEAKAVVLKHYFDKALRNVNLLYIGGDVWLLVDLDYLRRFWCALEASLATCGADASGLIRSTDNRHTMLFMGIMEADPSHWEKTLMK